MYERLITQCENDQADALAVYDKLDPCLEAQRVIRTKLVTTEVTITLPQDLTLYPNLNSAPICN
jgi:hypothetical protein